MLLALVVCTRGKRKWQRDGLRRHRVRTVVCVPEETVDLNPVGTGSPSTEPPNTQLELASNTCLTWLWTRPDSPTLITGQLSETPETEPVRCDKNVSTSDDTSLVGVSQLVFEEEEDGLLRGLSPAQRLVEQCYPGGLGVRGVPVAVVEQRSDPITVVNRSGTPCAKEATLLTPRSALASLASRASELAQAKAALKSIYSRARNRGKTMGKTRCKVCKVKPKGGDDTDDTMSNVGMATPSPNVVQGVGHRLFLSSRDSTNARQASMRWLHQEMDGRLLDRADGASSNAPSSRDVSPNSPRNAGGDMGGELAEVLLSGGPL